MQVRPLKRAILPQGAVDLVRWRPNAIIDGLGRSVACLKAREPVLDSSTDFCLAPLQSVTVVMVATSHPGNVGAAARALRAMGLDRLVLVDPRFPDAADREEARAFASGADDVLDAVAVHPTIESALANTTLAVAVSAAPRDFGPAVLDPERGCARVLAHLRAEPQAQVALVFGAERTGLSVEQVQRCQALISIPTQADFPSLNLAQAVQLIAWELRRALLLTRPLEGGDERELAGTRLPVDLQEAPPPGQGSSATHAQIEAFMAHFEQALVAVQFLDPTHPKKLMPRLRRLFARSGLQREEVDLLRGVCKQMILAAQGALPGSSPGSSLTTIEDADDRVDEVKSGGCP